MIPRQIHETRQADGGGKKSKKHKKEKREKKNARKHKEEGREVQGKRKKEGCEALTVFGERAARLAARQQEKEAAERREQECNVYPRWTKSPLTRNLNFLVGKARSLEVG